MSGGRGNTRKHGLTRPNARFARSRKREKANSQAENAGSIPVTRSENIRWDLAAGRWIPLDASTRQNSARVSCRVERMGTVRCSICELDSNSPRGCDGPRSATPTPRPQPQHGGSALKRPRRLSGSALTSENVLPVRERRVIFRGRVHPCAADCDQPHREGREHDDRCARG